MLTAHSTEGKQRLTTLLLIPANRDIQREKHIHRHTLTERYKDRFLVEN